jgi:hypothetical protein
MSASVAHSTIRNEVVRSDSDRARPFNVGRRVIRQERVLGLAP